MDLNFLEIVEPETIPGADESSVLHLVCMPCNGGVVTPLMQCFCGYWDDETGPPGSFGSMPMCEKCEALKKEWGYFCPRGHTLRY